VKDKFLLFKELDITQELREDLNTIVWAGSLGMVFFVCLNGAPFAGFVRALGVSELMYGILMSLPVVSGVFQVLAAYVLESTGARKWLFFVGGMFQRLSIIPVVLLPLIIPEELKGLTISLIVFFLLVSAVGSAFNGVTFMSWMAALIPLKIRGRFFSQRQMMFTFTSMLGGMLASWALDRTGGFVGFAVVFSIVTIFAIMDIVYFVRVYDPPMVKPRHKLSMKNMWNAALQHSNFRRYLIFWAVWVFGVNISGPFFNAYMIDYLKMKYLEITLYTQVVSNVLTIFVIRKWGMLVDIFGNKPVLRVCGTVASTLPLLWLLATPKNYAIIPFIHVFTGMFWSGIDLTSNNLVINLSPDENRSFYVASFSMVTSVVGSIVAYALGGLFMEVTAGLAAKLNIMIFGHRLTNYHMLFMLSAIIRFIAITFLVSPIHEDESVGPREMIRRSISMMGDKNGRGQKVQG